MSPKSSDTQDASCVSQVLMSDTADRTPGPIREAGCWSHARRPFFALADIQASAQRKAESRTPAPISPLALEVVQRMDRLFEIERGINGRNSVRLSSHRTLSFFSIGTCVGLIFHLSLAVPLNF